MNLLSGLVIRPCTGQLNVALRSVKCLKLKFSVRCAIYILGVRDGIDRGRAAWDLTRVGAEKMKGPNWFENVLVSG